MLFFTIGAIGSGVFAGIEYLGAISGLIVTALIWAIGNQADGGPDPKSASGSKGLAFESRKETPAQDESTSTRGSTIKKLIVGGLATYFVVVGSTNLLSGNYAGEELEQVAALLIILFVLWLIWRSKKVDLKRRFSFKVPEVIKKQLSSNRADKLKGIKAALKGYLNFKIPEAIQRQISSNRANNPRRSNVKYPYVDEVAEDLRSTARKFEDPYEELFFVLRDLKIRRLTNSQEFTANALFQISRSGFNLQFVNVNSRTGKVRTIEKKWKQTIGVTPDRFELYLQDQSLIEFFPLTPKSSLYMSAFWQVFNDALNGSDLLLQNPVESGLGHKLREVANYIIENRETVGPEATFELSNVESKITDEEFLGYQVPKFPEVRDKIQGWRLLGFLGKGGFGQVFKAENVETGELGAIKLMSPNGQDKKKLNVLSREFRVSREGFLAEAALSSKVSSPFIASAIDSGDEPWPWIRYPLIKGKPPAEAWNVSKDRSAFWWNMAHDLVSALNSIHTEGMVHKDIKPDNILMTKDCFVVLDFGVGEVVGYGAGVAGTPGFIAPEIYTDESSQTRNSDKTDIFAAGVTLFSLRDPSIVYALRAATSSSSAMQELVKKPIDLSSWPPEMAQLLSKMLSFDPSERASAKLLLKDIAKHVDLDLKLELIERHKEQMFSFDPSEHDMGSDETFDIPVQAPISSWAPIEAAITEIVDEIKPRFFVVELGLKGTEDKVYVQAISGGGGWILEAMSEKFSTNKHSRETKSNFIRLGWTPPSKSEPNYIVNSAEYRTPEIVRRLVDAFEFGYPVKLDQIERIEVSGQGKGKY